MHCPGCKAARENLWGERKEHPPGDSSPYKKHQTQNGPSAGSVSEPAAPKLPVQPVQGPCHGHTGSGRWQNTNFARGLPQSPPVVTLFAGHSSTVSPELRGGHGKGRTTDPVPAPSLVNAPKGRGGPGTKPQESLCFQRGGEAWLSQG